MTVLNAFRSLASFVVPVLLAAVLLHGCNRVDGYPAPSVTTPIGQEGVCAVCGQEISTVEEDNLVTRAGIQLIVCSEECAEKVETVLENDHSR